MYARGDDAAPPNPLLPLLCFLERAEGLLDVRLRGELIVIDELQLACWCVKMVWFGLVGFRWWGC